MGRHKKYTPVTLKKGVKAYLRRISRTVDVTESIDSGKRDSQGHVIYIQVPVVNDDNEHVEEREYLLPPTITALCRELGISRETWSQYAKDPDYAAAVEEARSAVQDYLERELLTRQKGLQGVIFALQANYGYSEKRTVELGPGAVRAMSAAALGVDERRELLRAMLEEADENGQKADEGAGGAAD